MWSNQQWQIANWQWFGDCWLRITSGGSYGSGSVLFYRNKRNQPGGDRGSVTDNSTSLVRHSSSSHSYHHLGGTGNVSGAVAVAKSVSSSTVVCKVPPQQPIAGVTADSHSKTHHPPVLQDSSDPTSTGPSQSTPCGPPQRSDSDDNSYRQSRETLANKEPMPPR